MGERDSPLGRMILGVARCVVCNARYGECDCWTICDCGWSFRKGGACGNPIHGGPAKPLEVVATYRPKRRKEKADG